MFIGTNKKLYFNVNHRPPLAYIIKKYQNTFEKFASLFCQGLDSVIRFTFRFDYVQINLLSQGMSRFIMNVHAVRSYFIYLLKRELQGSFQNPFGSKSDINIVSTIAILI